MKNIRMLVLLDGSERALDAIHYIASVDGFSSMTVVVLYSVYAQVPPAYLDLERKPEGSDELERISAWRSAQEKGRMQYIRRAQQLLEDKGFRNVEIQIRQIVRGVARDIIAEAHQNYAAVVMTRRGMGLLAGLPLGSVATKVLQSLSSTPIILADRNAYPNVSLSVSTGPETP